MSRSSRCDGRQLADRAPVDAPVRLHPRLHLQQSIGVNRCQLLARWQEGEVEGELANALTGRKIDAR